MNNLKKIYINWFSSIYKSFELLGSIGGLDFRAVSIVGFVELILVALFFGLYVFFTGYIPKINLFYIVIPIIIALGVSKYWLFYKDNRWVDYITHYNSLRRSKRIIYLIISWAFNIAIFILMIVVWASNIDKYSPN